MDGYTHGVVVVATTIHPSRVTNFNGTLLCVPIINMKYFVYCRKSSESEDRQILSIDSQEAEINRLFGSCADIQIVEVLREAYSAKTPGRPIFSKMLERIERGEAQGIITWHPDRLARNSMDGGRIIYFLDQRKLLDLKFASFSFENNSQGKFMLSIIFGYSKYYVDNLSENVKRGNRAKVERGWRPGLPPLGYLNCKETKTIIRDPATYPLVERVLTTAAIGANSVKQLWFMARDEWGLRTPATRRRGGGPLSLGAFYKVLGNPYYTGHFLWHGQLHRGKHDAILSMEQFGQIQRWLGRPGRQKPKRYGFTFTGLIRCGVCGLMVTAERKINRFGSRYLYYHCTKRNVGQKCRQPSVETRALEAQIVAFLESITIDQQLHDCLVQEAMALESRSLDADAAKQALARALAETSKQEETVLDLRVRGLISDQEFLDRRNSLQLEKARLEEQIAKADTDQNWFEPFEALISFRKMALKWFRAGDSEIMRLILQIAGSNFLLKDKILNVEAAFPFSVDPSGPMFLQRCGSGYDVRTLLHKMNDAKLIDRIELIKVLRKKCETDRQSQTMVYE